MLTDLTFQRNDLSAVSLDEEAGSKPDRRSTDVSSRVEDIKHANKMNAPPKRGIVIGYVSFMG